MAARRRPSMRTRMKVEDVCSWVEHNNQLQPFPTQEPHRVRFDAPPSPQSESDSDSDSEGSLCEKPVYLDGGYAWFVVLCSFIMHAIVDGTSFCIGIIYLDIQNEFKVDHFYAMVVAAMFLSLPLCNAPVAGIITDFFSCRTAILIGGIICTVSSVISLFCTNIFSFTLFLGVGCGFGMSFIYNAAIVIVTYYFHYKRGTATSIAVAGTGCGTFMFPGYITLAKKFLAQWLSPLRAALAAYSLAFAIIVIIGIVIEDVAWSSDSTDYKVKTFEKMIRRAKEEQYDTKGIMETVVRRANSLPILDIVKVNFGSIQSVCEVKTDGKKEVPTRSKSVALFDSNKPSMPPIQEYSMINTTLANLEHLDLELANSPCTTVRAQRRRVTSKISMSVDQINELDDEDFNVRNLFRSSSTTESATESSSDDSEMSNDGDSSSSELTEKKVQDPNAKLISKVPLTVAARATSSAPTSARLRTSLAPGTFNVSGGRVLASNAIQSRCATNLVTMGKIPSAPMLVTRKKRKSFYRALNLNKVVDQVKNQAPTYKTVLLNSAYQYLMLSVACLYFTLDVPYVCFYDYGMEHLKMDETSAKMIYSSIGVANIIFTIVYGKLSDILGKKVETQKYIPIVYIVSMMFVATTLFSAKFVTSGSQLIVCGVFFGIFVTSNYVLQSILVTIVFDGDMDLFQSAYSMVNMMEGLTSFIGPMVFAKIRQETGSYEMVFIASGCMQLLAAFFAFMFYRRWQQALEADEEEDLKVDDHLLGLEDGHGVENGIGYKYEHVSPLCRNGKAPENENLLYP